MSSFLNIYGIAILAAGVWFVLLTISNAVFFRVSRRSERKKSGSMLSVLIPARNEEKRIVPTLRALLDQDYDNFEIVVIDDNSTDKTWKILEAFAETHGNLTIMKGEPLPDGWKGKPFAMSQLAAHAKGEIFVFVDADMVPGKDFLSWVAERMERHGADSMSAYARHRARSFLEYLAFPLIYLVNMTFLPFWLIKKTRTPLFSHAIGQLMIFTREAYEGSGGFARVRNKILEDIQTYAGTTGDSKLVGKLTASTIAVTKGVEITTTFEHEELYGMDSVLRQDVAKHTASIDFKLSYASFNPDPAAAWEMDIIKPSGGYGTVGDSNTVYVPYVIINVLDTTTNYEEIMLKNVYFESLPTNLAENDYIVRELTGKASDIRFKTYT